LERESNSYSLRRQRETANLGKKGKIKMLEIPTAVGGRFSSFTPVGLLPSCFLALEIEKLLQGLKRDWKMVLINS